MNNQLTGRLLKDAEPKPAEANAWSMRGCERRLRQGLISSKRLARLPMWGNVFEASEDENLNVFAGRVVKNRK